MALETAAYHSTMAPAPTDKERLTRLQGLRLIIQAAQLIKNQDTRLRHAFKQSPGTPPATSPDYLSAQSLEWLERILALRAKPASPEALNRQLNRLTPKEILLQNPQLL